MNGLLKDELLNHFDNKNIITKTLKEKDDKMTMIRNEKNLLSKTIFSTSCNNLGSHFTSVHFITHLAHSIISSHFVFICWNIHGAVGVVGTTGGVTGGCGVITGVSCITSFQVLKAQDDLLTISSAAFNQIK